MGQSVTVVEALFPAAGTSGGTFGRINSNVQEPWEYFELKRRGVAAHFALHEASDRRGWFVGTGSIKLAVEGSEAADRLASDDDRLQEWGYPVVHMSGADAVERLEPSLRLNGQEAVSFYPREGFVFPRMFVAELLARAKSAGVGVMAGARVVGFKTRGGRVAGVGLTTGVTVPADTVIVCSGRWTEAIVQMAGASLPLVPSDAVDGGALGFLGTTHPGLVPLERVVITPRLSVRPDGGGRLLLHSFELDPRAAVEPPWEVRADVAGELAQRAGELLDSAAPVHVESLSVGVRPIPSDGLPAVGWVVGAPSLYVAVAHSGITLAPVLGELVAREVVEGRTEPLLAPFRPDRFGSDARGCGSGD